MRGVDLIRWRRRLPASAPRWLSGLLGAACVGIGLVIVVRPLMSLDAMTALIAAGMIVSGLAALVRPAPASPESGDGPVTGPVTGPVPASAAASSARSAVPTRVARGVRAVDLVVAIGWVVAGITAALLPGLTVTALVWLVGVGLVLAGLSRGVRAWSTTQSTAQATARSTALSTVVPAADRASGTLLGAASAITGVLALTWPDITVLTIAVLFGARTLWFGLVCLWGAATGRPGGARNSTVSASSVTASAPLHPASRGGRGRAGWMRVSVSVVAVVAAVCGAVLSAWLQAGAPAVDAFYAAPSEVPTGPGALIRSEPFTRDVPAGANGWRILYTTTDQAGRPTLASALVVAPADRTAHPVIAWAHGTTGYAQPCAPSLATQPFASGALFVADDVVQRGWALVATDYAGLGTSGSQPYLIGQGEARSVLDAVRAARQLADATLSDRTVVWGHSQGGHAALWTGQIAASYAPDVPLLGVEALAPASDLTAFAGELTSMTGGSVFASYVISAYAAAYPDVRFDQYVRPSARVLVKQMAGRCLAEPGVLVSVLSALSLTKDPVIWSEQPTAGPLARRLDQNVPRGPFDAPVVIAQGLADPLIPPAMQQRYVAGLCHDGQRVSYRTYPGRDHLSLVEPGSPAIADLLAWTADRFAGKPATSTCAALG